MLRWALKELLRQFQIVSDRERENYWKLNELSERESIYLLIAACELFFMTDFDFIKIIN